MKILKKGFLLLGVAMLGLCGCGENEIKTATEIKELVATYESNIDNADFSKFTLTYKYTNKCEYNHDAIDEIDEFREYTISYDESGYLYYKNQELENTYSELWLYIDETNLILASNNHANSSDKKRYDILAFDSYEEAYERFLEESPKRLYDFVDWFTQYNYEYNNINDIPKKYCLDYYETASNLCERVINELDPYITVHTNDGTILDISFSRDERYVFENGLLKSYDSESSGTRQFDKYGIGTVTETYESSRNINLLMSCDSSKPDLSTFEKIYH